MTNGPANHSTATRAWKTGNPGSDEWILYGNSLLVPHGVDRFELGRLGGRIDPENEADRNRYTKGERHRQRRDPGRPVGIRSDSDGYNGAHQDSEQAAADGHQECFDEKLCSDVTARRADGPPDADFMRPLDHRRQHDVHDADAADDQRQDGDAAHDNAEGPL